jgi:hypothetical protein
MKSKTPNRPDRRTRRALQRLKGPARHPSRSFEVLESRFLLSDATPAPNPVAIVQIQTVNLKIVDLSPTPLDTTSSVVGPSSLAIDELSLQDDSFSLAAGDDFPAVQVGLLLSPSQDEATGLLQVSSTSGQLYYNVPLSNVEALHAELPIPSAQATPSTLGIDLLVSPPGPGSNEPGSFQVSIYWNQDVPANDPLSLSQPQAIESPPPPQGPVGSPAIGSSPLLYQPSQPSYPSITVTQNLPAFVPPTSNVGDVASKPEGGTIPLTGQTPGSAGSSTTSGTFSSKSPGAAATSSISDLPTTNPSGTGNRAAIVGPLPLSAPTPDGGIFAYPNASSRVSDPAIEPTTTIEPSPVNSAEIEPRFLFEAIRRAFGGGLPVMRVPPNLKAPVSRPSDLELSSEPSEAGELALPLISELARLGESSQPTRQTRLLTAPERSGGSSRTVRVSPSIAAALIVTASLFFGLVAPDCAATLSDLSLEERSIERRLWSVLTSKRRRAIEPS